MSDARADQDETRVGRVHAHEAAAAAHMATRYAVDAENRPRGVATISARTSTLAFDGSAETGELLPGPADLLAAALAACILKNVERFSRLLPFRYEHASVHVEVDRAEPPPRIVRARYTLRIVTDEPEQRVDLLHRNNLRFGTITNTLAAACELSGRSPASHPPTGVGHRSRERSASEAAGGPNSEGTRASLRSPLRSQRTDPQTTGGRAAGSERRPQ